MKPGSKGQKAVNLSPKDHLPLVQSLDLQDEADLGDFKLVRADLGYSQAKHVRIETAFLEQVSLTGSTLQRIRMGDVELENCDLSNAVWKEAHLARIRFSNCRLIGANLTKTKHQTHPTPSCVARLLHAFGASFIGVEFEKCSLKSADFRGCDLSKAIFKDCDLDGAEFFDANLDQTDFRSSFIGGIKARPHDLKGCIVTSQQVSELAPFFAQLLGLEVI